MIKLSLYSVHLLSLDCFPLFFVMCSLMNCTNSLFFIFEVPFNPFHVTYAAERMIIHQSISHKFRFFVFEDEVSPLRSDTFKFSSSPFWTSSSQFRSSGGTVSLCCRFWGGPLSSSFCDWLYVFNETETQFLFENTHGNKNQRFFVQDVVSVLLVCVL